MRREPEALTIRVDPDTARWARIEARRQETSVSAFVGALLRREKERAGVYEQAMARYLTQSPTVLRPDGSGLPAREQVHDCGESR
jgi:hypothetical protein